MADVQVQDPSIDPDGESIFLIAPPMAGGVYTLWVRNPDVLVSDPGLLVRYSRPDVAENDEGEACHGSCQAAQGAGGLSGLLLVWPWARRSRRGARRCSPASESQT